MTPELLLALRAIAPKPRRSKLPAVLLLAVAVVVGVVGMDPSARELVVGLARAALSHH